MLALVETVPALQRLTERQAASGAILFLLFPKISGYTLRFSGALCNALHYKRAAFTLSELSRKYATIWGRLAKIAISLARVIIEMQMPCFCHPEPVEGSLLEYRHYFHRDPSKARVVLPCLQGVKRARRNRRHMDACPWQIVAESVSFFAADYSASLRSG